MKVTVFDTHDFERANLIGANSDFKFELSFLDVRLSNETASLAKESQAICCFTSDKLDREVLKILAGGKTKLIALRCAGFNNVDLVAAKELGLKVVRVPDYSPYSVAEYAVGLLLCLNRKIHKAYNRVREGNFVLDGLVGFDLHGKTIGVVGTGHIGKAFIRIMRGFGCQVLACDLNPDQTFAQEVGCSYTSLQNIVRYADIISLHVPLTKSTTHLIDLDTFMAMKKGCILINTGRGALIDTKALIKSLKSGHLGAAGLDVYEEEANVFFQDHSGQIMQDDLLSRLMTFPNVLLTSHQGFLTKEALWNIADTTFKNLNDFETGRDLLNEVHC